MRGRGCCRVGFPVHREEGGRGEVLRDSRPPGFPVVDALSLEGLPSRGEAGGYHLHRVVISPGPVCLGGRGDTTMPGSGEGAECAEAGSGD